MRVLLPHHMMVWAPPLSLATTYGITFVFSSSAYLDVSVQRVPFLILFIYIRTIDLPSIRFPHSDICGSLRVCQSPQLFAAYYVFLRLLVLRQPPYALFSYTSRFKFSLNISLGFLPLEIDCFYLQFFFLDLVNNLLLTLPSMSFSLICNFHGTKYFFKINQQPPILPYRYQHSIFGHLRLNLRVRDGNECFP